MGKRRMRVRQLNRDAIQGRPNKTTNEVGQPFIIEWNKITETRRRIFNYIIGQHFKSNLRFRQMLKSFRGCCCCDHGTKTSSNDRRSFWNFNVIYSVKDRV